jgi:type III restriction enzyme
MLSLFFLDAVADYRVYETDGSDRLGPIGELFEEELTQALEKPRYRSQHLIARCP